MALTTPNLGLIAWNDPSDPYDSEELAENWIKLDLHDHTPGKGVLIGTAAIADQSITTAKIHPTALPDLTIDDGAITEAKLANNAVTTNKLANDSVTTGKILAGAVGTSDLAASAVTRATTSKAFIQGKRAVVAGVTTGQVITWDTPFATANYTVVVTLQAASNQTSWGYFPMVTAKVEASVTVDPVVNSVGVLGFTGTIHAIGIAD